MQADGGYKLSIIEIKVKKCFKFCFWACAISTWVLRFSKQVPWEGAIKVWYHEYLMLTPEWWWGWNVIWKSQTLFQLPYLADTSPANVSRWRCYLFIRKPFRNSTLEDSTSGQGPLCKIAQYMYACVWGDDTVPTSGTLEPQDVQLRHTEVSQLTQRSDLGSCCTWCSSKGWQQCRSISSPRNFSLWALGQNQFTEHFLLRAPQEIECLKNNPLPEGMQS